MFGFYLFLGIFPLLLACGISCSQPVAWRRQVWAVVASNAVGAAGLLATLSVGYAQPPSAYLAVACLVASGLLAYSLALLARPALWTSRGTKRPPTSD